MMSQLRRLYFLLKDFRLLKLLQSTNNKQRRYFVCVYKSFGVNLRQVKTNINKSRNSKEYIIFLLKIVFVNSSQVQTNLNK